MNNIKKFPRVLIVSDAAWTDDNNIGNTFSNLFIGYPKENIAMVYARPSLPSTSACERFFQISESRMIKNLLKKDHPVGIRLKMDGLEDNDLLQRDEDTGKEMYRLFHKVRFPFFLAIREILWKVGRWKNEDLDNFIEEFKPDVILSLACNNVYMSNIQQYIINYSKVNSAVYFVDDVYSKKRLSISPVFWLNKYYTRKKLRELVRLSNLVYTIIPKQKEEYDECFGIDSLILNKGGDFNNHPTSLVKEHKPLSIVYTGNIYVGRWDTIIKLGEALDRINDTKITCLLYVYTANELTTKMKKDLEKVKSIKFMGSVPANEVSSIQDNADILLHVESMNLKEKLSTRLSFSTKLVDYFTKGKPILAIGWGQAASIDYLKKNNIAVVIDNLSDMNVIVSELINNIDRTNEIGKNAVEFGKKNHDIDKIRANFISQLSDIS